MSKDSAAALAQASETPRMALAPSRLLFGVPSRSIMIWSIWTCSSTAMSLERLEDLAVDGLDRLLHALAEIARLVAVAQFDRLMRAGGGARRHRRAADRAVFQHHIDLDGGIAAAIENFAADDVDDGGHGSLLELAGMGRLALLLQQGCEAEKAAVPVTLAAELANNAATETP